MGKGGSHMQVEQQEEVGRQAKGRALLRQERKTVETNFEQQFKAAISIIPPTSESLERFDLLLQDEKLERLEYLVEFMKVWDAPNTIPEPKSFLYYARLQPVLVQMLEDIVMYRDYLERFIIRFNAENENTAPKNNPKSKSDAMKPSAPIHYAVLQLNSDFLDWLLERPNGVTDVNLRNSFKQTALTLLCENYDQCMRKSMQACPPGWLENIRSIIIRLLQAGADFNICSIHMKLPFDLLLKHCGHEETRSFVEECVKLAPGALAICSVNDRNERVVGFFNNNPDVIVTVELLEIFLRYTDRTKFDVHMRDFKVNEGNVKKVIRLLLHTACDQKLSDCVRFILDRGEKNIFKIVQRKSTRVGNNLAKESTAPGTSSVDLNREYSRLESVEVQNGSELEHRVELKGLLKKLCLMADLPLLQRFLAKISDLVVLNDDPLLVVTITKAYDSKRRIEERNALLACAEYLATQETIHMSKKDNSGNTSLHLALKYGFDSVALALLRQRHTYLGMRNNDNLTPLDYGTYGFWKKYFDQCIEIDLKRSIPDRDEIRFNLNGFYSPLQDKALQGVGNHTVNADVTVFNRLRKQHRSWKMIQRMDKTNAQPHKFTSTVTEMTTLRQIAQSKELKRLLIHPVLYTFIMVKWTRLCHWNYLNLLLTALTIVFFGHYSLTACSADGPSTVWLVLSIFGVVFVVVRELLQLLFLRRSYLSFENVLDIVNAIVMAVVLGIGCHGLMSSFVIISLAMQLTFLMGSLQSNSLATMMYMFKTVSKNFLKSFLLFMPLIGAFIYAFHLTYNQSPEEQKLNCDKDDCAEDNFNNFRSFWNATVKTLVMTTGEFEAAAIDFEGGKMLLFIVFLFFAPIVILNLINGLAVSDIAAIREESELISISKKVMLLEQYERGVANVYPAFLKRCFPKPFFSEYQCRIHIKTKEYRKIVVHVKVKAKQPAKSVQGSSAAPNSVQGVANKRLHGSSQCSVQIVPAGNPAKQKVLEKSLSKFPWLLTSDACNYVFDVRFFRLALFMRQEQVVVDEALAIIEKQQAIASLVASKGTPTTEVPVTPVNINVSANQQRQQRTVSTGPPRKPRCEILPTQTEEDVLRELTDVKGQLKTVLELLRRKEHQEMRRDTQPARDKRFKRKAVKRVRKGLKKAIAEQQMGDR